MTREEILSHVDHTLLKPEATWPQIKVICDEAVENHTASICINTCYVKQAVEYLAGRIPRRVLRPCSVGILPIAEEKGQTSSDCCWRRSPQDVQHPLRHSPGKPPLRADAA